MKYSIGYRDIAQRQLLRLDISVRKKIVAAIDRLSSNPRPTGSKKLRGRPGYRVRVGDYRIIYDIHDRIVTVEIVKIGHRKDIYR